MEFDFSKFVQDIESRNKRLEERSSENNSQRNIDLDEARRLRSKRYHERWQNRIVWEKNNG